MKYSFVNTILLFLLFIVGCKDDSGDGVPGNEDGFSNDPIPNLPGKITVNILYRGYRYSDALSIDRKGTENLGVFINGHNVTPLRVSPNGNLLVYSTIDKTVVMRRNGEKTAEGPSQGEPSESDPGYSWSPDSRFVYYGVYFDGIYEIDTSTGQSRRILTSAFRTYDHSVVVSPDGIYLYWAHHESGILVTLYRISRSILPAGYNRAQVMWEGLSIYGDASIYPEFLSNDVILFAGIDRSFSLDRESILRLNTANRKIELIAELEDIVYSALSPDKTMLLVGTFDLLYTLDIRHPQFKLVTEHGFVPVPLWSPDSKNFVLLWQDEVTKFFELHLYETFGDRRWKLSRFDGGVVQGYFWR